MTNYTEGFNHGYLYQKKSPEMAEILSKDFEKIKGYGEGFRHGRKEHMREQQKNLKKENPLKASLKEKQKSIPTSPHKGKGKGMGR